MADRTKLLRMVEEALDRSPPDSERQAQYAIDAVAEWFDDLLDVMGVQPSAVPTLLRWQAHQHEYLGDD